MPESQATPQGRRQAALERRDTRAKPVEEPHVDFTEPEEEALAGPGFFGAELGLEEGPPPVEEGVPTVEERLAGLEALNAELLERLAAIETRPGIRRDTRTGRRGPAAP